MNENVVPIGGVLPYGGANHPNSGHAGSNTSADRAEKLDSTNITQGRQRDLVAFMEGMGAHGVTWKEYSAATGMHHGATSGTLSTLHKAGVICRLTYRIREKCKVYVLPQYVHGRETDAHGQTATTALLDEMAEALRAFMPEGSGCPWHRAADRRSECRFCAADEALAKFEARS